jgi:hypothetical protein
MYVVVVPWKVSEIQRSFGRKKKREERRVQRDDVLLVRDDDGTILLKITPSHNSHSSINNKTTALAMHLLVTPPTL